MFSLGQNVAGSPGSRQLSHHLIWGLGLSLKRAFNKKCSGKPLVFWNYFNNENKNNKELVSILSFLLPLGSAQDISYRWWRLTHQRTLGLSQTSLFHFYGLCDDVIFLAFHFHRFGAGGSQTIKVFFGGYFFLLAARKLPVITGLSSYPKLGTLA